MDKRELKMYKIQDVIEDLIQGKHIKSIARTRKISKNTVKKYRELLHQILGKKPDINNSVSEIIIELNNLRKSERYSENFGWLESNMELVEILSGNCSNYVRLLEVLKDHGFKGSYSALHRYLEKNIKEKDTPVIRIETQPGKIAQVDFGNIGKIFDEGTNQFVKAYVFVMVLGYSRDAYYEIVRHQDVTTWCDCHIHAFEYFGGVPEIIIPDNLKSAITKASFFDPVVNKSYSDLARHYGFQIDPCLPETPEHKGKVESGVKYMKNNFMPLREFKNFADANNQLTEWMITKSRVRIHGTTRKRPQELFEKFEKSALMILPQNRCEIPLWKDLKVGRDTHIQFDCAYYSVPYEYTGEYVNVRKTSSQIAVFHENKLIAVHFPREKGKRSTKYEHYPSYKHKYIKWDSDYCISMAESTGENTLQLIRKMLNEEPLRNLKGAQKILGMSEKFGTDKLEKACKFSIQFGNYTYQSINNILEKNLNISNHDETDITHVKLDDTFARDITKLLN